jgi:hypothetical protein
MIVSKECSWTLGCCCSDLRTFAHASSRQLPLVCFLVPAHPLMTFHSPFPYESCAGYVRRVYGSTCPGYMRHPCTESRFDNDSRALQRPFFRTDSRCSQHNGSWLNMAEIEIVILQRKALPRLLEDEAALRRQVVAVEAERNTQRRGIGWQFTSRDARIKLERLYPVKETEAI